MSYEFIMDPVHDAVQVALLVLRIPCTSVDCDGRAYNNARLMRWGLRALGEETFRELVYRQWRENMIDGLPESTAATFQAKLNAAVFGDRTGGVA